jgi:LEA14-like dessication related protein
MAMPDSRVGRSGLASAWVAGLFAALLCGCASIQNLEPPKLSMVSLKMQSADIFSQRLQVRMRVMNPNSRELPIKGITYRIEVNDVQLGEGATDTSFVVPAMGEAEFDMTVTANLASSLAKFLARGSKPEALDYRLVGSVALSSGFLRRIPFDERGSVKLK